jgi:hypothetical protein
MWQSATLAALVATEWTMPSLASTPIMRLQAEVELIALPGLVHRRVALATRVLARRRRMQDGRIDDRARRDPDAPGVQMHVHRIQH